MQDVSSDDAFIFTFLPLYIAVFVSQVLLCIILWDIGTKYDVNSEISSSVDAASFDEEA
jgi:TRAP-type C4-dicarboxylate transport system permease small subunit